MVRRISKVLIVLSVIFFINGIRLKAEEKVECSRIQYEKPNGKNGYYTEAVDIEIEHLDKRHFTKYALHFPDGKTLTGALNQTMDHITLEAKLFEEGVHRLVVWMEDDKGNVLKKTKQEKEVKIDRNSPKQSIEFFYEKKEKEPLTFSDETTVIIESYDSVSGVEGFYYRLGDGEYEFLDGEKAEVTIPLGFEGKIAVYAIDYAGNKSEEDFSKEIICENEPPKIEMNTSGGFRIWHNEAFLVDIRINEGNCYSGIREIVCSVNDVVIQKRNYNKREKIEDKLSVFMEHSGDIVVEAVDWAGNYHRLREKVLFDSEEPEIEIEERGSCMSTDREKSIYCEVSDNQRVVSVAGEIVYISPEGKRVVRTIDCWEKEKGRYHMTEFFREVGEYEIYIEAVDQAGNENKKQINIKNTA